MKTTLNFYKLWCLAAIVASALACNAQPVEYLNANNVNAGFGIGGNLFSSSAAAFMLYEAPKGRDISPIYTASVWLSGLDAQGKNHCAAQRYAQGGPDFYNGPVVAIYNAAYDSFYSRVFKITKLQIEQHHNLGNNIPANTFIDEHILHWPAKGNQFVLRDFGVEINSSLAPFIDLDGDNIYNPYSGDVPAICGEQAVFFVFNDVRGYHHETNTAEQLGIEIRGLAEDFTDDVNASPLQIQKRAINNCIFVSYEIENKSQQNYHDFYIGMFEDPDLGCFNNDRATADTLRSLICVYNEGNDPDCNAVLGYNDLSVAFGTKLLDANLSSFVYFENGTNGIYHEPFTDTAYRNNLMGLWDDGSVFLQGGTSLPGVDLRMVGSSGPANFAAAQVIHFNYAFITAYDSTANSLTIVDTLKRDADLIQTFYDNVILPCRANPLLTLSVPEADNDLQLLVYPNPASSSLMLEAEEAIDRVALTDMLGRTVLAKTANGTRVLLNVATLPAGVYLIKIKAGNKTTTKKIVIE
jgi:hypothetical protein